MKRNIFVIAGAILFCLGFCMATGVEQNPIQAVYALASIGAASWCFNRADRKQKRGSNSIAKAADYQKAA